jgi:hypothetical protein
MNIEVLTPAFLRDIGALDVRDALEYVSGIQLDTTTGGVNGSRDNPENTTLLIRGISAGDEEGRLRPLRADGPDHDQPRRHHQGPRRRALRPERHRRRRQRQQRPRRQPPRRPPRHELRLLRFPPHGIPWSGPVIPGAIGFAPDVLLGEQEQRDVLPR